ALGGGVKLALQIDDDAHGPGLTPLRWGKTERWVKSGAGWYEIRHAPEFDPAQAEVFNNLAAAHPREWFTGNRLRLHDFNSDVWRVLRSAVAAGIPLLPSQERNEPGPTPRILEEAAHAAMTIGKGPEGLVASPTVL